MKKEQEFHELIEQQDEQNKRILWNKIKTRIDNEIAVETQSSDVLVMKKSKLFGNRNVLVAVAIVLAVAIAATGILLWKLLPNKDSIRYCQTGDYFVEESALTIQQYAQENNIKLLYFDCYDEWDYIGELHYKLNDSDEIVCIQEEIVDSEGVMLTFYVTDNLTDMDFLDSFVAVCRETKQIMSTTIYWHEGMQEANALFEYQGFNYYIKAEGDFAQGYILDLVQLLFDVA